MTVLNSSIMRRWLGSGSSAFNNLNEDRNRMHNPVTGMSWQHRNGVVSFNLPICVFYQNVWGKYVTYFNFTSVIVTAFKELIINSASQHRNGVVSLNLINLSFLSDVREMMTHFVSPFSFSLSSKRSSSIGVVSSNLINLRFP